ncbi:MAG: DNA-binding FadR family transcriptional regulator [Candidatus Azotimanducaceae bacterium]|jgi:DNA-binding FadR family transcriptional regulator
MTTAPSKADEICAVLRTEILTGQYRAGERLPSERDLAARFEANRGAVREALKKIEQLGIVSVAPGGVRVLPVEDATLDVLGHLLELGEIQQPVLIGQVMDVLGVMTSLSARSAIKTASDKDIEVLVGICGDLISSTGNHEKHHENWMRLSEKLMSIHQNLVLRLVGNGLRTQFLGKVNNLDFKPDVNFDDIKTCLTQLRDAVAIRDGAKVRDAIITHFEIIKTALLALNDGETKPPRRTDHG